MMGDMGQRGKIDWTIDCLEYTDTDDANIPTPAYSTVVPPVCLNQNFAISEYSAIIPSIKIDFNNTISRAPSVNAVCGYARVDITARKIEGSISPDAVNNATAPFYANWSQGLKSDLTIQFGSNAGNKMIVTAPRVHYTGMSFGDRAGVLINDLPFQCAQMAAVVSGTVGALSTSGTIKDTGTFVSDNLHTGGRLTIVSGTYNTKARIISSQTQSGGAVLQSAFGGSPTQGTPYTISLKEIQLLFL